MTPPAVDGADGAGDCNAQFAAAVEAVLKTSPSSLTLPEQISGVESNLVELLEGMDVKAHPHSKASDREVEMELAGKEGFSAQSKIGKRFTYAIDQDETIAKAYKDLNSRQAKATFRKQWAAQVAATMREERVEKETDFVEDSKTGKYMAFGQIVAAEGGDHCAYVAAVQNVKSCMELYHAGKLWKGRHFVKFNTITKRAEFLHFEEQIKEGFLRENSIVKTASGSQAPQAPQPTPAAAITDGTEPSAGSAGGQADAAGQAGGKQTGRKRTGGTQPTPASAEVDAKRKKTSKDEKKIVDGHVKTLGTLKSDLHEAAANFTDIMSWVASDESWSWAKTEKTIDKLRAARDSIEPFKKISKFWIQWNMMDVAEFAKHVRKDISCKDLDAEMKGNVADMDRSVKKLASSCAKLKRMHRIHMGFED